MFEVNYWQNIILNLTHPQVFHNNLQTAVNNFLKLYQLKKALKKPLLFKVCCFTINLFSNLKKLT